MLSKDKIRELVKSEIEKKEKPGEQSGGSGHLAHVDYTIDSIKEPVKTGDNWKITYSYTTIITTEFTVYPDNPPYENHKTGEIILNNKGENIH